MYDLKFSSSHINEVKQKTGEINFSNMFPLTPCIQNIIIPYLINIKIISDIFYLLLLKL